MRNATRIRRVKSKDTTKDDSPVYTETESDIKGKISYSLSRNGRNGVRYLHIEAERSE